MIPNGPLLWYWWQGTLFAGIVGKMPFEYKIKFTILLMSVLFMALVLGHNLINSYLSVREGIMRRNFFSYNGIEKYFTHVLDY